MKGGVAMMLTAFLRVAAERLEPAGRSDPCARRATRRQAASSVRSTSSRSTPISSTASATRSARSADSPQWVGGRPVSIRFRSPRSSAVSIRATIRGTGGHPSTVVRGTAAAKARPRAENAREAAPARPHHAAWSARCSTQWRGRCPLHQRLALRPLLVPTLTDRLLDLFGKDGAALDPLLHNTATPTVIRGGDSTNVIPTEVTVDLDGRVLPGQTPADLVRELEALASGTRRVRDRPRGAGGPSRPGSDAVSDARRDHPRARAGRHAVSDAASRVHRCPLLRRLGIQTYGFLPMRLPPSTSRSS